MTAKEYAQDLVNNLDKLWDKLRLGKYQAPPVKRVYIPKAGGKQRPLGLTTIEDKIAQNAVSYIQGKLGS